ncbi:nucleotidyltransferase domain-containing protein [Sutcliffiella horikoshii]|uniref:nucleotidyltransferase domain-containing protein n=1 Tax=Sutcliffiella horikoshii TaxID=79883 RepID=UPI001CFEAC4C|nr:nucleotidyltransferase domain-containing protein [Sutcliffiella horikoshii]
MNRIEDILINIEENHNVKILYACEAGSRAYGFATESSDFDIRFIYIAPLKKYLSLFKKEDTITKKGDVYDIQGWDLKKALVLAGKSNPSFFEWMLSPIVYRELDSAMDILKGTIVQDYSKKVLALHYVNMAKNNLQAWSKKNDASYLVHAVRASLMLEQVINNGKATIEFEQLIKNSNTFTSEDLSLLFCLKTEEKVPADPLVTHLNEKVNNFIAVSEDFLGHLEEGRVDVQRLEELFFQQLGIEGE